jgi:hypothetical protein
LIDRIDSSLLADALEAFVQMPDHQYQLMQKAARKKIENHYSAEVVGNKLTEIFQSISSDNHV